MAIQIATDTPDPRTLTDAALETRCIAIWAARAVVELFPTAQFADSTIFSSSHNFDSNARRYHADLEREYYRRARQLRYSLGGAS